MNSAETDRGRGPLPEDRSGSFDDRLYPHVVPILFVGGTGRSGTHIVSQFLGRNNKLAAIPVECRFHVDDDGFPGLLDGRITKARFLRRLRGFWWKGRQTGRTRGMFRFVDPEDFESASFTLRPGVRRRSTGCLPQPLPGHPVAAGHQ